MFNHFQKSGLKVNSGKLCVGAHKFEYFGYHVTRDGVMTITNKFESIQALTVQKTRKKLRHFIDMIKSYRDLWQYRSELLAPLIALTSKNVKYKWKDDHQECFDAIKCVIGLEIFLAYSDFNAPF